MSLPDRHPDYPDHRVAPLRDHAAAARQETVARLEQALADLAAQPTPIPPTAQAIYAISGLHYQVIRRNPDAYRLFQQASPGLAKQRARKAHRRRRLTTGDGPRRPDPWTNETRSQLAVRVREANQRIAELDARLADAGRRYQEQEAAYKTLALDRVALDLRLAELEAHLVRYETVFAPVRAARVQDERENSRPGL